MKLVKYRALLVIGAVLQDALNYTTTVWVGAQVCNSVWSIVDKSIDDELQLFRVDAFDDFLDNMVA